MTTLDDTLATLRPHLDHHTTAMKHHQGKANTLLQLEASKHRVDWERAQAAYHQREAHNLRHAMECVLRCHTPDSTP